MRNGTDGVVDAASELLRDSGNRSKLFRRIKPSNGRIHGRLHCIPRWRYRGDVGAKPLVVHEPGAHAGLTSRALAYLQTACWWGFLIALIVKKPKIHDCRVVCRNPQNLEWLGTRRCAMTF
jgi:hypothetical protein